MIVCANCSHLNLTGAVFCQECGAPLLGNVALTTQSIQVPPTGPIEKAKPTPHVAYTPMDQHWVTLHLLETGQVLPLSDRNEFTMGRSSEGQPIVPDIDLSPYQGYASGVSRLHAVIKRGIDNISLMDLNSSNGTYVNGKRLKPHEEQPLEHGDVVALGKLKIQILLKLS
jgi:pSer/pThr/pTyr-binding forkhead associated (FHA) protein